jgi:hypothetical protein
MMMSMYELVDTHTGNWLGAYSSREEALTAVGEMLRRDGEGAIANVALGRFERGADAGEMIAEGHALAEMARTPA